MSTSQPLDQIRYCERCGISFLWSAEEQRIARTPQPANQEIQDQEQDPEQTESQAQNQDQNNNQHHEPVQKRQVTPPSHCPGCRLLLPPAGRERGLVKWYNRRKRYGFLVRHDQPEIFAHGSDLQGTSSLRPGDLVEFSVEIGDRGPAAKEIVVIDHTDAPTLD